MTEKELLDSIRSDPARFSEIFRLYYNMIFGYVFRRTADFDVTRDVVSEIFQKAFLHINQFNYRGISVKVWLYRIATNEVNLYFRYRKFIDRQVQRLEMKDEGRFSHYIEEDRNNLNAELQRHEQFILISEKIKELPLKYQEVIALRYFENKNNREIAEILDKKEGTIKSLHSRGVRILKKKCNPG